MENNNEKSEEKEIVNEKPEENIKEEKEVIEESAQEKKKKNKFGKKAWLLIAFLAITLLVVSTIFAIFNMNNSNIIKGVFIEKVDVSNLSKEELDQLVKERISLIEDIELKDGEYSTILKLEDIGLEINSQKVMQDAIYLGRTNHILIDNYEILKTNLFKTKLSLEIVINQEKFEEMIKNIEAEIPDSMKEYSYEIQGDELVVTAGKAGKVIEKDKMWKTIIYNVQQQFNGSPSIITIPTKYAEPENIDIEKIHNEIYKVAKDAYIVEEPFELHKEEDGVEFLITLEEAKELLKEEKETYLIPLNITKANKTVKDLGDKLFKQSLAKYTTIYDAGNYNRASNIALAAKTINGTILLPGETFSYNGTLGNTTKEKGYKEGGAYVDGKVVQAYGGGICQVSTTLYNVALYANLEIIERHNHSYSVAYVPAGRDATVAYGGKDFKFKNSRNYPIRIDASAKNGVVSISIMGIKEEKEYEIELTSAVLSTTPATTIYENNNSLAEGTEKVIQKGHSGQKSVAYKIIKYNGQTISKEVLSKDTYLPMSKIVQVGPKKAGVTSTPTTMQNITPVEIPAPTEMQVSTVTKNIAE